MIIEGRCWKFGDNINTDLIIPARYMTSFDPAELGRHCMEDADPTFARAVRPGDIIVAGENFGCGSSREHAVLALKGAGVAAVVAVSFARIFFRNSINTGLPIVAVPDVYGNSGRDDRLRLDLALGKVDNLTTGESFSCDQFPPFLTSIIRQGGLLAWAKSEASGSA